MNTKTIRITTATPLRLNSVTDGSNWNFVPFLMHSSTSSSLQISILARPLVRLPTLPSPLPLPACAASFCLSVPPISPSANPMNKVRTLPRYQKRPQSNGWQRVRMFRASLRPTADSTAARRPQPNGAECEGQSHVLGHWPSVKQMNLMRPGGRTQRRLPSRARVHGGKDGRVGGPRRCGGSRGAAMQDGKSPDLNVEAACSPPGGTAGATPRGIAPQPPPWVWRRRPAECARDPGSLEARLRRTMRSEATAVPAPTRNPRLEVRASAGRSQGAPFRSARRTRWPHFRAEKRPVGNLPSGRKHPAPGGIAP